MIFLSVSIISKVRFYRINRVFSRERDVQSIQLQYSFDNFSEKCVTKFRELNAFFSNSLSEKRRAMFGTREISNAIIKFEFLCWPCAFFPPFPFPLYYQASLERTFNSFDIYVISPPFLFLLLEKKKKKKRKEEKTLRYCALETH